MPVALAADHETLGLLFAADVSALGCIPNLFS